MPRLLITLLVLCCACSDPAGGDAGPSGDDAGVDADAACVGEDCDCQAPQEMCGESCIDTRTHALHCGGCDTPCPQGVACRAGACAACQGDDCCDDGQSQCDDGCVDTATDVDHCGGCGNTCDGDCAEGRCTSDTCEGELCDGECVDTQTDADHCGRCSNGCGEDVTCRDGLCECSGDELLCEDGCTVVASDDRHCGDCETACDDDETCDEGVCTPLVDPRAPAGHLGTLFWTAELDNRNVHLNDPPTIDAPFGFLLVNPGDEDAHISVTDPDGDLEGASTEVIVFGAHDAFERRVYSELVDAEGRIGDPVVGTLRDIVIPPGAMLQLPVPRYQVPDDANTFESLGWRITSDLPIAAFMFNPLCCNESGTAGASMLLPAQAAGTRYLVATPPHASRYPATLTVMAADTQVNVTVTLTDPRLWGGVLVPEPDRNGVLETRVRTAEVLNLETMLRDAPPNPDLSGSVVEADGPVSAWAGHACARLGGGACDHVEEQLVPTSVLGTRYVVPVTQGVSWVQFVADQDTVVTLSAPPAELSAAQGGTCDAFATGAELTLPSGAHCTLPTEIPLSALSTTPVLVATYQGANKSMHQHLPVARWRHRYLVPVPTVSPGATLLVAAPAAAAISVDGEEVVLEQTVDLGESSYVVGTVDVGTGPHDISSDLPLGLSVFGTDSNISWSFPGGFAE
jgi:hypothetical protein